MDQPKRRKRLVGVMLLAGAWWLWSGGALPVLGNDRVALLADRILRGDADGDGVLSLAEVRALASNAATAPEEKDRYDTPPVTSADVPYGPFERNLLDFWQADAPRPTPLIVFIHGGGFIGGSKALVNGRDVRRALAHGVSFAAINYRFRTVVPLQEVVRDCGRAVQFLRSQAAVWHLDPQRIAAYGDSAGAGAALWLAAHDDLADPGSPDPVLRESTRLSAAGCNNSQFTYDLKQWEALLGVPAERYYGELYSMLGLPDEAALTSAEGRRIRADLDLRALLTPDDPPVYLYASNRDVPPTTGLIYNHHPLHSIALARRCKAVGVPFELHLARTNDPLESRGKPDVMRFLLDALGAGKQARG